MWRRGRWRLKVGYFNVGECWAWRPLARAPSSRQPQAVNLCSRIAGRAAWLRRTPRTATAIAVRLMRAARPAHRADAEMGCVRSEERRVGDECWFRWWG